MKIAIREERRNPLMKRTELIVDVEHGQAATPSRAALQQLVATHVKKGAKHVDIRNIFSLGGKPSSYSKVFVWDEQNVDDLSVKKEEAPKEAPKEAA